MILPHLDWSLLGLCTLAPVALGAMVSTRAALKRALGLGPDATDDEIHKGVDDLMDDPEEDKTAAMTPTAAVAKLAELTEARAQARGITYTKALDEIKADPKYRGLTETAGQNYQFGAR